MNMDGQAIALLHAADRNRTALRIEKGKFQFRGRAVFFAGNDAAESVFRLPHDDIARIDRECRLGLGSVDIVEVALFRDRKFMALSRLPFGKAALCHDRGLEPGIVGHCESFSLPNTNFSGNADRAPASDRDLVFGSSSASSRRRLRPPKQAGSMSLPRNGGPPSSNRPASR